MVSATIYNTSWQSNKYGYQFQIDICLQASISKPILCPRNKTSRVLGAIITMHITQTHSSLPNLLEKYKISLQEAISKPLLWHHWKPQLKCISIIKHSRALRKCARNTPVERNSSFAMSPLLRIWLHFNMVFKCHWSDIKQWAGKQCLLKGHNRAFMFGHLPRENNQLCSEYLCFVVHWITTQVTDQHTYNRCSLGSCVTLVQSHQSLFKFISFHPQIHAIHVQGLR